MAICAENKRKTAIVPKDYTNILVSLWKMITEKEYNILCLGALITSYVVFTTNQCSKKLESLSEVGILTGINNITDCPERILNSKQRLRQLSKFSILIVSIPIYRPHRPVPISPIVLYIQLRSLKSPIFTIWSLKYLIFSH